MQNKKKVLFYLWSFSLGGGAEKILATIVNNLDPDKYDIDILEMEHFDKPMPKLREGINILKPYKSKKHSSIAEAIIWRLRFWFPGLVRRHVAKDNYDIEISFTIMNPPLQFSKRKDVKKIAWIHGSIENMPENEKYLSCHRKHLGTAETLVAISEKTRESIENVFPEYKDKITTIYNGYNFDDIRIPAKEDCGMHMEEDSMCCIGRIEKLKGTDRTLELLNKIHQMGYKYHLYLIGTGDMDNELKERTSKYGLQNYVHFLGYQTNPYKFLSRTKLLVSMSYQEGFSGAFVEAISLGKPFVSTDVGGAKELSCNGKFGKIITSDEEAVEAIISYISGREYPDADEMAEFIEEFTVESQIDKIERQLFSNQKGD